MLQKSHLWLIATLGLLLLLFAGCAGPTGFKTGTPLVLRGRYSLLTGAASASQMAEQIISFQPESCSVTFPTRLRAHNPWLLYTAVPAGTDTRITVIDLRSASVLQAFLIPGTYASD